MAFSFNKLKVGALVEMTLLNDKNTKVHLNTIVENVLSDRELDLFAPIYKGVNFPLRSKQGFDLIMISKHDQADQYDIHSCRCKVVERKQTGSISIIKIQRVGEITQIQRRDYFRLPLIKSMTFLYENRVYQILSKDLSGNGIRGFIDLKLPIDAEGVLQLDTGTETLSINFIVIDCNTDPDQSRRYELRANFHELKSSQLSKLLKYIYARQSETIRKQIDFKSSSSLYQHHHYSDFFDMPTREKISRISPPILWALTLTEIAYFSLAFKNLDVGLNHFFKVFRRTFRPEFLNFSAVFSIIIWLIALIAIYFNETYNRKTKTAVRLHILANIIIAIVIFTFSIILKN